MSYTRPFGDDTSATAPAPVATQSPSPNTSIADVVSSDTVSKASFVALTYHGYRRTGSIIWALLYGLAGREYPIAAVPIALAQGFGKKKPCP